MGEFDYLSVITSIVLGLSLTQLLTGLGRMIQLRRRVRFYWPAVLAMLALILADVQFWWSLFGLRGRADWDFASFLIILLQAIMLSVASTVLIPAMPEGEREIDLKTGYFDHAGWYYALLLSVLAISLAKSLILDGHLPRPTDVASHGLFSALFLSMAVSRSDRWHKIAAPTVTALFLLYIAVLFARLGVA